eukprot:429795_1
MTKRKRDFDLDERFQDPTDNTDIFGREIPESKKRKLSETEITNETNVTLQRIQAKLKQNKNNNQLNTIQEKLQKITSKALEKESKRDGLDKHNVINWERHDVKQIDYKLDEQNFKHDISNIIEQKASINKRENIIKSVNNKSNDSISEIVIDKDLMANKMDETHFNAIFSKPKLNEIKSSNDKIIKNDNIDDSCIVKKIEKCNDTKPANRKKKKSWRQRVKKYQSS